MDYLCDHLNKENRMEFNDIIRKDTKNTPGRFFLYTNKKNNKPYDLLLFYHGSCECAWNASMYTGFSGHDNIITVFGQARGEIIESHPHPEYGSLPGGYTSFGELYWEIRDLVNGFTDDLDYTKEILNTMREIYCIRNIYFVGHSNGGVFGLLLAVYLSDLFDCIVSHQGGMGFDPHFCVDFSKAGPLNKKPRMLFYTGTNDVHKEVCEQAHELFKSEGYQSQIYIENGLDHQYDKQCEEYIFKFLENDYDKN